MKKTKLIVRTKSKNYSIIIGSNILKDTSNILKSNNSFEFNIYFLLSIYNFMIYEYKQQLNF